MPVLNYSLSNANRDIFHYIWKHQNENSEPKKGRREAGKGKGKDDRGTERDREFLRIFKERESI